MEWIGVVNPPNTAVVDGGAVLGSIGSRIFYWYQMKLADALPLPLLSPRSRVLAFRALLELKPTGSNPNFGVL